MLVGWLIRSILLWASKSHTTIRCVPRTKSSMHTATGDLASNDMIREETLGPPNRLELAAGSTQACRGSPRCDVLSCKGDDPEQPLCNQLPFHVFVLVQPSLHRHLRKHHHPITNQSMFSSLKSAFRFDGHPGCPKLWYISMHQL